MEEVRKQFQFQFCPDRTAYINYIVMFPFSFGLG